MSTDESPKSDPASWFSRQGGRLRGLMTASGAITIGALAGCNALPGTDSESPAPGSGGEPVSGDSGTGQTGGDGSGASTGTADGTDPAAGMSATECSDGIPGLETELEQVEQRRRALETALPTTRRRAEILDDISELFEPVPEDVLSTAEQVGMAARDAVVFLELPNGMATGWFIDDHHIITNAHNVFDTGTGGGRTATAWTFGGAQYETTMVDFVESFRPDVAVLHTDDVAPATLTPGSTPSRGTTDYFVQVGHPGGVGNWMRSVGRMRSMYELQADDGSFIAEIETTIPGRQGVSGSPVLDLEGRVVGLTYAGMPIRSKPPEEPPIVAPDVAYDRPVADLSLGTHVGIDGVMKYYEAWTR